jgi:hypothetical protein
MPRQVNEVDLESQFQMEAKLTLKDLEENSIDQLIAQPSQEFKETLKKLLITNNEEIARLANLNKKILECLERIDQQNQEVNIEPASGVNVVQQNTSKVSLSQSKRKTA